MLKGLNTPTSFVIDSFRSEYFWWYPWLVLLVLRSSQVHPRRQDKRYLPSDRGSHSQGLYSGVWQRILFTDTIDDPYSQYSKQDVVLVQETPELYERVVKPFIAAFPPSRTKWVEEIIAGRKEADKVFHRDDSGSFGYMIIPDMKWNLETVSDLYLLALCTSNSVKSLRDLRKVHVPVLRNIKDEAARIVNARWKNGGKDISLRMFIHYQPSYCVSPHLLQLLPTYLGNVQIISTSTS